MRRDQMRSALLVVALASAASPGSAEDLFCPVQSDPMRFREELFTHRALAKTVEVLRAGVPNPLALLQNPTEAKLESTIYLYNSTTIIEGFRLRSDVQHKQALLELRRLSGQASTSMAAAQASFEKAREDLCSYLEAAEYAP